MNECGLVHTAKWACFLGKKTDELLFSMPSTFITKD
jgi:hypothetical protein